MSNIAHDDDCPACTHKPDVPLLDYATYCAHCGQNGIQGCTEHKVNGELASLLDDHNRQDAMQDF